MSGWEAVAFHALNGLAGSNLLLDAMARVFVGDYFVPVLLSLILLGLWFAARDAGRRELQQRAVLAAIVAVAAANLVVIAFDQSRLVERPRPFLVNAHAAATADSIFYRPPDPSFPSNSMAVAFAMAAAAWRGSRRAGLALGGLGVAMGLARVYAGIHFPYDVLAGAGIGVGSSFVALWTLRLAEPVPSMFLRWARRFYLA